MPLFDGVRYKARMIKAFLAAALCGLGGGVALAQGAMPGTVKPFASVRFAPDPDVACLASALETGNPATGASTWILKAPAGCVVPWHSHTAQEQLIMVQGEVMAEVTGHSPTRLGPGGFAVTAGGTAPPFPSPGRQGQGSG